jgi:hypothetical protein
MVNGNPDAVLMDTKSYEKQTQAANMARLLARAKKDIPTGRTRPIRSFLKAFKRACITSRSNHARGGKIV